MTVKRSTREGRWAEIPSAPVRFAGEAVFLLLVAAGAALAKLSALQIILVMFIAWVLVALIERASSRAQTQAFPGTRVEETPAPSEPEPTAVSGEASEPTKRLRWPRRREVPALAVPTATLEERPSRTHVRRLEPEPVVEPEPVPQPEPEPEIVEPVVAGPTVTKRPLELTDLEVPEPEAKPAPEPEPEPVSPPAPAVVAQAPPPAAPAPPSVPPPAPREWNLWELERRARDLTGDVARDEEWTALFVHLREYANTEGVLPAEFDGLVRESFAELIAAA